MRRQVVTVSHEITQGDSLYHSLLFFRLLQAFLLSLTSRFLSIRFQRLRRFKDFIRPIRCQGITRRPHRPHTLQMTTFRRRLTFIIQRLQVTSSHFRVALSATSEDFRLIHRILHRLPFRPTLFFLTKSIISECLVTIIRRRGTFSRRGLSILIRHSQFTRRFPLTIHIQSIFKRRRVSQFRFQGISHIFQLSCLRIKGRIHRLCRRSVKRCLPTFQYRRNRAFFYMLRVLSRLLTFRQGLILNLLLTIMGPSSVLQCISGLIIKGSVFILQCTIFLRIRNRITRLQSHPPSTRHRTKRSRRGCRHRRHRGVSRVLISHRCTLYMEIPKRNKTMSVPTSVHHHMRVTFANQIKQASNRPFVMRTYLTCLTTIIVIIRFLNATVIRRRFPYQVSGNRTGVLLKSIISGLIGRLISVLDLLHTTRRLMIMVPRRIIRLLLNGLPFPLVLRRRRTDHRPRRRNRCQPRGSLTRECSTIYH